MNISSVNFGAKIPISEHNVYDKRDNKFVKTTLYQIDGKDEEDLEYVRKQEGDWGFLKDEFLEELSDEHKLLKFYKNFSCSEKVSHKENKFYTLEQEEGKSIGLLQVTDHMNRRNIFIIRCNPENRYKYVGQVMIAATSKDIQNDEDKLLTVEDPLDSARGFYTNICGFHEIGNNAYGLEMNNEGVKKLIKDVENRTNSNRIDIVV